MGVEPAGENGGWFQQVTLRKTTPQLDAAAVSITKANGEVIELKHLDDFRVFLPADKLEADFTAPLVYVGHGIQAPGEGHDDYANVDVNGKIVVISSGAPDSFQTEKRAHFGSSATKAKTAAANGAIGTVSLYSLRSEKFFPWERFIANPSNGSTTWVHPNGVAHVNGPGLMGSAVINPEKSQLLFDGAAKTFDEIRKEEAEEGVTPQPMDLFVSLSIRGAQTYQDVTSPNVVGVIPGADPVLKNEYIVLSGHLDHTGVNEKKVAAGEDGINNGAVDNALGVSTMIEAAKMILEGERPARSILVLAVTAEEKGLLGADHFAHYPTVPKDGIVANVNLDMPVVLHPFTDVIAFGAERSSIGPITTQSGR